jgi:DNA-binding helix-hairpin-helix protein with protein kinase domain
VHQDVAALFKTAVNRLANQAVPPSFQQTRQRLQAEKDELTRLPAVRLQRMAELNAGRQQKQLTRFLEKHRIEDASIPGIGPGRKTLLRCYNIEDANDVIAARLNIKGFGPSLRSSLLAWRAAVERSFVFNPSKPVDAADIRALEQEIAQKRAALIQSLSTGVQQLQQALLPWQTERARLMANLEQLVRQLAQADVNRKALGRL